MDADAEGAGACEAFHSCYAFHVSASELLKQVGQQLKKLPAEEREKFLEGILNLESGFPGESADLKPAAALA